MSSPDPEFSNQQQLRAKAAGRRIAADATFEEKIEKVIELQKITYELARQAGRPCPKPWQIELPKRDV